MTYLLVGTVGSGKSSLVSAILGEMIKKSGTVTINVSQKIKNIRGTKNIFQGSIAYVPQQAWIQNATIRENISFAKEFNDRKFRYALKFLKLFNVSDDSREYLKNFSIF